jgi:kynurenine 3-monooxygenase
MPGRYVSRYELVSFSTMPYADIPDRMRRQNRAGALVVAGAGAAFAAGAAALRRRRRRD